LQSARDLQVAADPLSGYRRGGRVDPQAQCGAHLRRQERARAHAGRQRERPERGPPLPGFGARRGLVLSAAVAEPVSASPAAGSLPTPVAASPSGAPGPAADPAWSLRRIRWAPACRIVPTRHPTVYLFDRVAQPEDFEALYALEALTNDRVR